MTDTNKNKRAGIIFAVICGFLLIWIGLLMAPLFMENENLIEALSKLPSVLVKPFDIHFVKTSFRTVAIILIIYAIVLICALSSRKKYRKGKEYGSAKWGDIQEVSKRIADHKNPDDNLIFSEHMRLGIHKVHQHRKNLNVLVDGGSGAGKTLFYVMPNILQANASYVILDPKGETLYRTGDYLKNRGYKVKVLDLLNMEKSFGYNPFRYIRPDHVDEDVQRLVSNIFSAANPKGQGNQDPFWDQTASMLLKALMLYIYYACPEEDQCFASVNLMLQYANVDEDNSEAKSAVDVLFEALEEEYPNHTAVSYYKLYRDGAAKTLKSIKISLIAKLERFLVPPLQRLTTIDEMELDKLGEEKTAIYAIIPDNDSSFNFLVSILYTQMFQQLYKVADEKYQGALPVQVHFVMDEFANVALPDNFQQVLATMRSRGVNVSIIIQNIAQLKKLFEKDWESLVGNCDEFLYLGGNEQSTHKYVSELLGKETIDTQTFNRSKGRNGSYTTNNQNTGRELLTSTEVRLLNNDQCILFVKGEEPIIDNKYKTFSDSRIKETCLGNGPAYNHKFRYLLPSDIWEETPNTKYYSKDDFIKLTKASS